MAVFMIGSLVVRKELHVGPTDGRFTTHSSWSDFSKTAVQQIKLPGDRAERRASREQPGMIHH